MAFWTLSDNLLNNRISLALRDKSGFLCVDLYLPTDFEALADLAQSGAYVSILFREEIATRRCDGHFRRNPRGRRREETG